MSRRQYPFHLIEPKWQAAWEEAQAFRAWNPGEPVPAGHPFAQRHGLGGKTPTAAELPPKFYILDMFPYPSGAGLHVGHPEGYTATDILARYRRACGFNVLHPMGWDSFGLPAEQYAVKTGQHPRQTTEANITTFKRQIKSLGFSYDWTRELATTDPDYFRWTQWIFLQLYNSWFNPETNRAEPISTLKYPAELVGQASSLFPTSNEEGVRRDACPTDLEARRRAFRDSKRLAYVSEAPVNWCPELGTVLANEEVIDGKSEVGGFPVIRRPMRQWMLRITAYAERLLDDLKTIDWSDSLKEMQRNWIGRSEGAEVEFQVACFKEEKADGEGVLANQPLAAELRAVPPHPSPLPTGEGAIHPTGGESGATGLSERGTRDSLSLGERAGVRGKASFTHPDGIALRSPLEAENSITVFTTRPDTLFGATYMVLSPEHKLLDKIVPDEWPAGTPRHWRGPKAPPPSAYKDPKAAEMLSDENLWSTVEGNPRPLNEPQAKAKAQELGLEFASLAGWSPAPELFSSLPHFATLKYHCIPVSVTSDALTLATDIPDWLLDDLQSLRIQIGKEIIVKVASTAHCDAALGDYEDALEGGRLDSRRSSILDTLPGGRSGLEGARVPIDPLRRRTPKTALKWYRQYASSKSDLERTELAKDKTGVFTGAYAINPVNGEKIPIWVADYVLASYGTGAIMAVPAHDTRDFEFAIKFNLPIVQVVQPPDAKTDWHGFVDDGNSVNSIGPEVSITGLPTPEAKAKITAWLESKGLGKKTINYKLRDWLFSRQRYWGEPFPIVWKKDAAGNLYHEALPDSALPVLPPSLDDYKPTADGQPPLARAKDWLTLPDGSTRETNTMPQWAGSCWYYLRYLDARRSQSFCGPLAEHYWMGAATEGLLLQPEQWANRLREVFLWATEHPPAGKRFVTYAVVGKAEAENLLARTGLDLVGYRRFIDDQAISHILAEHGDARIEAERGQLPVSFDDLLLIPEVVSHPDRVLHDRKTGMGLEAILYEKQINGFICCVEEVRTKHQLLAVKTLFKKRTTAAHAAEGSLDHTSETLRRSEGNKLDSTAAVKPTPGVDLYVGGTEHAVLHLLYARFWHKVLFDLGHVSTPEPFFKLVNQGLILGEMELTAFHVKDGRFVSSENVEVTSAGTSVWGAEKDTGEFVFGKRIPEQEAVRRGDSYYLAENPSIKLDVRSFKMSKSRGNVINPDDILVEYGADAFRLYEMFMGPLEMVKPWNTKGVEGVYRFLGRAWRLFVDEASETEFEQAETTTEAARRGELLSLIKLSAAIQNVPATPAQLKTLHTCIKKVTEDLDGMRFNTAISAMMVFTNETMTWEVKPASVLREFLILLQPFAPHLAEELWQKLSTLDPRPSTAALAYVPWPTFDPALLVEDTLEIPVQVNGKLRDVIRIAATATDDELKAAALAAEKAQPFLAGKTVRKIILVQRKLVNIIAA